MAEDSATAGVRQLLHDWSEHFGVAVAALSRGTDGWRFEGAAFPTGRTADRRLGAAGGSAWTGIELGRSAERDWLLIVPGPKQDWRNADMKTWMTRFRAIGARQEGSADDAAAAR